MKPIVAATKTEHRSGWYCPLWRLIFRFRQIASALSVAALLSGCALTPYAEPEVPRPGLVPNASLQRALENSDYRFEDGTTNLATSYVTVDSARAYAQFVQDAYRSALQRRSQVRTTVNALSIAGALSALGMGIVGVDQEPVLITGFATTFLGISGQLLLTKNHETAYSLGAQAVGCVVSAATNARPSSMPLLAVETAAQQYASALAAYRNAVEVARARAAEARLQEDPTHLQRLELAQQRLARGNQNLAYARRFLQSADILGEQLVNKVEEIRWAVDDAVRRSEPDVIVLDRGLRDIVSRRLAPFNLTLPAKAGAALLNTPAARVEHSATFLQAPELNQAWFVVNSRAGDLDAAGEALRAAMSAASGQTMRFDDSTFSSCGLEDIEQIMAPGGISFEPQTAQIPAGQPATVIAIVQGTGPFSAFENSLSGTPTVQGSRLSVPVTAEEAAAGRTILTPVANLYGQSAVFTLTVSDQPGGGEPALAPNMTPAPDVTPSTAPAPTPPSPSLITSSKVAEAQRAIDPASVDGTMGERTRRGIIADLRDQQARRVLAVASNPGLQTAACQQAAEAFFRLTGINPGSTDADARRVLDQIYPTDAAYAANSIQPADRVILDFYVDCNFTL